MKEENRELAQRLFRQILDDRLRKKFGRRISAQRLADQFNLRAKGTTTISRETARKWMSGLAIPQYERLVVLVEWLALDPQDFLSFKPSAGSLSMRDARSGVEGGEVGELRKLVDELDPASIHAVLTTARALLRTGSTPV